VPRVGDEDATSGVGRNELSYGDGGVAGRSGRSRFKDITKKKCQTRKRWRNSGQSYVSRSAVRRRPKLLKPNVGRGVMNKFLLNSVKISYIHFGSSVT